MSTDETKSDQPNQTPPQRELVGHTKHVQLHEKVIPTAFSSVHSDKALVMVDYDNNIATITFLQRNITPQISPSEGWIISEANWQVVGEIKMPVPQLNAMVIYYISQITGGLNIIPHINKFIADNPSRSKQSGVSFGPSLIRHES